MTKKFWNDWQKRIGETYRIELFNSVKINDNYYNKWTLLSHAFADDKIIKATFNGDVVDLAIKKYRYTLQNHLHEENLYVKLERTNIKSIEFNRYTFEKKC